MFVKKYQESYNNIRGFMNLLINNKEINIKYANTFLLRLCGLIGKKNINYGIFFPNCNSIHTFFMKEEIDVLMLNKNYQVKYIYRNLKSNKIIYHKGIKYVLELPKNTIGNIKINDYIKIETE